MITLNRPTVRRADEFLRAVWRSRPLHKGLVSPPNDIDAFRAYVNSLRRRTRTGFLVDRENSSEVVGVINVNEIVLGDFQSAYLGYYAFLPFAGQGMMRQGMQKVIRHCFKMQRGMPYILAQ